MANTITRKQLINALIANADLNKLAEWLATDDIATVADALTKLEQATNRKRVSKPSADTLKNRALAKDIADEVIARNQEFTAAQLAEIVTDADGYPMSSRKVGALLKNAASMGLIEKSPEKWPVAHYAPCGFAFAPKPERKTRKDEGTPEVPED